MSPHLSPILLLFASNVFMTFAWYGHLKFKAAPLWIAVMASWGIAFVEYWFAVPANRIGSAVYSAAELKTLQEVITLLVFAVFSVLYLKEPPGRDHAGGVAPPAVSARGARCSAGRSRSAGTTRSGSRSSPRGRSSSFRRGDAGAPPLPRE